MDTDETEHDGLAGDAALMARICWHYFKEGQTQEEVARRLGLTRKRINRVLSDARASGFVQITINAAVSACAGLETRLVQAFGLRRAIVVPTVAPRSDVRAVVGAAAGQYVSAHLAAGATLGIAWGGTISAAAQNTLLRRDSGNTVVLLCGGLARSTRVNPYDNAAMFARALDATCFYVTAPLHVETAELREALVNSASVGGVLRMVDTVDMALLSAIDLSEHSKALEYEVISSELWRSLRDGGAVGEVCGHYLTSAGKPVDHPIAARTVAAPLEAIRKVPELVLAAGGKHKVPIVRAALRAGLCHVLITDESAASLLLAGGHARPFNRSTGSLT